MAAFATSFSEIIWLALMIGITAIASICTDSVLVNLCHHLVFCCCYLWLRDRFASEFNLLQGLLQRPIHNQRLKAASAKRTQKANTPIAADYFAQHASYKPHYKAHGSDGLCDCVNIFGHRPNRPNHWDLFEGFGDFALGGALIGDDIISNKVGGKASNRVHDDITNSDTSGIRVYESNDNRGHDGEVFLVVIQENSAHEPDSNQQPGRPPLDGTKPNQQRVPEARSGSSAHGLHASDADIWKQPLHKPTVNNPRTSNEAIRFGQFGKGTPHYIVPPQ